MIFFSAQAFSSFFLSLVIKTVPTSIISQSYPLAQDNMDWLPVFCSYSETGIHNSSFPKEPQIISLWVNEQHGDSVDNLLCASTFLGVAMAVLDPLGLLCSAVNSGLAHLSKLSGFLFPAWPKLFLLLWLEEGGKELMGRKLRKVEKCEEWEMQGKQMIKGKESQN